MVLEILKISIPALIVFLTAYYVLRTALKKEHENTKMQLVLGSKKIITPIRLQAYERVLLFLERISPNSVILRVQTPSMTVSQLHKEIIFSIRTEYEHNLSQQLYISSAAWEQVRNAKELTIKLINSSLMGLDPKENAILLSQTIFDKLIEMDKSPTQEAIDLIKEEVRVLF